MSRKRRQDLCHRKRWCLKNCFAILWLSLLALSAYNHGLKGPQKPKHMATIALCDPIFHPLSLLLGRDPCGDRILRACLQKGPATTPANYAFDKTTSALQKSEFLQRIFPIRITAISVAVSTLPAILSWEEKANNMKKFGGTPPYLDCKHSVDVSRLSHGNVPFVPRTFCPIYVGNCTEIRPGRPRCPGTCPQTVPGTLPRPPYSFMFSLFIGFSSPQ